MVGSSCHIQENQNEITQVHSICFCNLGQQIIGQETGNLPCVVTTTYTTTCRCRCILLKKPVTQYNSSLESRNLIIFFLNENYECRLHAQEKKLQKYSILHSLICHQNQLQTNLGVPFLATPFCYLI